MDSRGVPAPKLEAEGLRGENNEGRAALPTTGSDQGLKRPENPRLPTWCPRGKGQLLQ